MWRRAATLVWFGFGNSKAVSHNNTLSQHSDNDKTVLYLQICTNVFSSPPSFFYIYYYALNVHVNNTTVHIFYTACSRIFRTYVRIDLHLLSFSSICQLQKLTFYVDSAHQLPQNHLGTTPPRHARSVGATRNAHTTSATHVINHLWRQTAAMVFMVWKVRLNKQHQWVHVVCKKNLHNLNLLECWIFAEWVTRKSDIETP